MVTSPNPTLSSLSALFTPTAQPLTVAEFRQFPNCATYSDAEAVEILAQLTALAHLVHDHGCQPGPTHIFDG